MVDYDEEQLGDWRQANSQRNQQDNSMCHEMLFPDCGTSSRRPELYPKVQDNLKSSPKNHCYLAQLFNEARIYGRRPIVPFTSVQRKTRLAWCIHHPWTWEQNRHSFN
ncbi:hypothetical protein TNCV_2424711 [Trichonephila clavipes]|nr:hypothetical protein TNCV_2424711 [Trichonephila clavipes]